MTPAKEIVLAKVKLRATADKGMTYFLGLVIHAGMVETELMEQFAGPGGKVYSSELCMPNGDVWEFSLQRRAKPQ